MTLDRRRDAFGNEQAVLDACPHCGHDFDDDGQAIIKHLPCEATPDTEEVTRR